MEQGEASQVAAVSVDVLFVHGAGDGAYDADRRLADSLARHLGDRFTVDMPRLPADDDPANGAWHATIESALARGTGPVVLVGHSAGGFVLLEHLSTRQVARRIALIGILAAPFPGGDPDWTFDGFALPDGFGQRLPADAPVLLYASADDEIVPFAHRALYAAAIPNAIERTTTGGHQLGDDLADVARDIRSHVRPEEPRT